MVSCVDDVLAWEQPVESVEEMIREVELQSKEFDDEEGERLVGIRVVWMVFKILWKHLLILCKVKSGVAWSL